MIGAKSMRPEALPIWIGGNIRLAAGVTAEPGPIKL